MKLYVGIDVGKHQLEVYYASHHFCVDNTKDGIKQLIQRLKKQGVNNKTNSLIVFEATGGYERQLSFWFDTALTCGCFKRTGLLSYGQSLG